MLPEVDRQKPPGSLLAVSISRPQVKNTQRRKRGQAAGTREEQARSEVKNGFFGKHVNGGAADENTVYG